MADNGCVWRALPDPSLPADSCKHPWTPAGVGAKCRYVGREDECPTKAYGSEAYGKEEEDG